MTIKQTASREGKGVNLGGLSLYLQSSDIVENTCLAQ